MTRALRRSVLYAPASNPRALHKLASLDCDAFILDLEDAVAPVQKSQARDQAITAIPALRLTGREVVVRCNGLDTPWGRDDLAALSLAAPDAVVIPKLADGADLDRYAACLPGDMALWAMIETCEAVLNLASIARSQRIEALIFGTNDLLAQMGARSEKAVCAARALTVTAARAAGASALDGVHNDFTDDQGLAAACADAADHGFDGKTLIHPRQIAICNDSFAPTRTQTAWARSVVEAFDAPGADEQAVLNLDGQMVERLHLQQARRLLAAHEVAISAHSA